MTKANEPASTLTMNTLRNALKDMRHRDSEFWRSAPKPGLFMGYVVPDLDAAKQQVDALIAELEKDNG